MTHAEFHLEHDRDSCDDEHLHNVDAEGSTGCARCTALALDRGRSYESAISEALKEAKSGNRQKDRIVVDCLLGILRSVDKNSQQSNG